MLAARVISVVVGLSVSAGAMAQGGEGVCPAGTPFTLLDVFETAGVRSVGQTQRPGAAWQFRRGGLAGPLLTGVHPPNVVEPIWAAENQAFFIPFFGPRISPDPQRTRTVLYSRPPSNDGLFVTPGIDAASDLFVIFTAPAPIQLTECSGRFETVGFTSDGIVVSATAGATAVLEPRTVPYTASGFTALTPAPGAVPRSLATGERVVIRVSTGPTPWEDWGNLDLSLAFSGAAVVVADPGDAGPCLGADAVLRVLASGSGPLAYRWQVLQAGQWRELNDGVGGGLGPASEIAGARTPALRVRNVTAADASRYRCVVTGPCGGDTSLDAAIAVCLADFNCDAFIDFFDLDDFVLAFETGDPRADINADGFLDFFDFDDFVVAFEAGC